MLLSMTGFGEATRQDERWTVGVEVRSVNNRHFKISCKISDAYAMFEPALEHLVREQVRRGSVQVSLRIDRPKRPDDYRINLVALSSYRDQLKGLRGLDDPPVDFGALLALPGVVDDCRSSELVTDQAWPEIAEVVQAALAKFQTARAVEGRAMAAELTAHPSSPIVEDAGPNSSSAHLGSPCANRWTGRTSFEKK